MKIKQTDGQSFFDRGYGTRTKKPVTRAKQTHNSYKYDTTVAACTTTVPRQLASPASPPVHIKTDDAPLPVPPSPGPKQYRTEVTATRRAVRRFLLRRQRRRRNGGDDVNWRVRAAVPSEEEILLALTSGGHPFYVLEFDYWTSVSRSLPLRYVSPSGHS